jgi:hypothetical protein
MKLLVTFQSGDLVEHTAKYGLDKDPRELQLQQFQEV